MKKSYSRRDLAKILGIGTGTVVMGKSLPEDWKKPVIDVVTLPAHGATTNKKASKSSED